MIGRLSAAALYVVKMIVQGVVAMYIWPPWTMLYDVAGLVLVEATCFHCCEAGID